MEQAMYEPNLDVAQGQPANHLREHVDQLKAYIESQRQPIQVYYNEFEGFQNQWIHYNEMQEYLTQDERSQHLQALHKEWQRLAAQKAVLVAELNRIKFNYDSAQTLVKNELRAWQRNQILLGNGVDFHDNLNDIQKCIEILVEMICTILGLADTMRLTERADTASPELNELISEARRQQQDLLLSSFIVEKQPPQVLKTQTKFSATIRWLIGPQLGVWMHNPTVECKIISETEAKNYCNKRLKDPFAKVQEPPTSGDISNNIGNMTWNQNKGAFFIEFGQMQIKRIQRSENNVQNVTDQKFTLLFYTTSFINGFVEQVWTMSLPVVVIVHVSQEPQSWATITWDNAFSTIGREPFLVPHQVSWPQLSHALTTKFHAATGRHLTSDNINFLYTKLFRENDDANFITWAKVCKLSLNNQAFTFWEWFFAIMKLTKDFLQTYWQRDLIEGFISRPKTFDDLGKSSTGTFLLRFSDSKIGSITVAFKRNDNDVKMLDPWTSKDLQTRSLAERLMDLTLLTHLYPNREKNTAFSGIPTPEPEPPAPGYVKNILKVSVPSIEKTTEVEVSQLMEDICSLLREKEPAT